MSAGACIPWHPYGCQRTTFAVCFLLILVGWAFLLVLLLLPHELDFELKDIFPVQSSHLCLGMLEFQMYATVLHIHHDLLFVRCFSLFDIRANNLASAWGKINFFYRSKLKMYSSCNIQTITTVQDSLLFCVILSVTLYFKTATWKLAHGYIYYIYFSYLHYNICTMTLKYIIF